MQLQAEHLSIPDQEYASIITINSSEFSKICKELLSLSDAITIKTSENTIQLKVEGSAGSGFIKLSSSKGSGKDDSVLIEVDEPVNQ